MIVDQNSENNQRLCFGVPLQLVLGLWEARGAARPTGRGRVLSNRIVVTGRDCAYLMAVAGQDDHAASRERAFFCRRKAHSLRSRQVDLMPTLLPRLARIPGEP